jgi:hypothetical protein
MVRISVFAVALIAVTQDRIASPFLCTVHAPQRAIPQPNFVPVSPRMSRKYQSRGMSGSPSKARSVPFTLSFTMRIPFSLLRPAFCVPREIETNLGKTKSTVSLNPVWGGISDRRSQPVDAAVLPRSPAPARTRISSQKLASTDGTGLASLRERPKRNPTRAKCEW